MGKSREANTASNANAAGDETAARTGVVRVVEVRGSRAPVGVATGRDALMAAAAENARGSAWGVDDDDWRGGGWGDDPADRREDGAAGIRIQKPKKKKKRRDGDDDAEMDAETPRKKKRAMSTEKTRKKHLNVRRYA